MHNPQDALTRHLEAHPDEEIIGFFVRTRYGNYYTIVPGVNTFAHTAKDEDDWDIILNKKRGTHVDIGSNPPHDGSPR